MSDVEEGVYFDLPDSAYRAIPALNASGMKNMRASPFDYWSRSNMNPDKDAVLAEEGDTEARIIGRAFHKRILEGRDAFNAEYAAKLDADDVEDVLRTQDDLKQELKRLGLPVSGNKPEQIARLLEKDETLRTRILECVQEDYAEAHRNKTFIDFKWVKKVSVAAQIIEADPYLSKVFSGGAPEASIVWIDKETGVPCKCRVDYVKSKMVGELKSLANMRGLPLATAAAHEFKFRRYAVQAQFELEGVSQIARLIKAGQCDGASPQYDNFIKAMSLDHPKTLVFVFQFKGIAPAALARKFTPEFIANSMTFQTARAEIEAHKKTYREYFDRFGTDPWVTPQMIEDFTDEEIQERVYA